MSEKPDRISKPRRIGVLIAGMALAAALSGCVVYPAAPGYYGHRDFHGHDDGWRGHGWHGRDWHGRDWR